MSFKKVIGIILLKGSVIFGSDLIRELNIDIRPDFMSVSSYGNERESTREVKIIKDLDANIQGKDVIIVEDIIDSGHTLKKVIDLLQLRNPKSLKVCTLLNKPSRREVDVFVDYVGRDIENLFIFGYGLDLDQRYRNIKHIEIFES
ncbi:MAG: hypoxanthine phosphoribosyltransferase [Fusobacteria bacterium]|nr:hypoxanthine phosphoribosyltransferase [Fusobacteriota bacterium]